LDDRSKCGGSLVTIHRVRVFEAKIKGADKGKPWKKKRDPRGGHSSSPTSSGKTKELERKKRKPWKRFLSGRARLEPTQRSISFGENPQGRTKILHSMGLSGGGSYVKCIDVSRSVGTQNVMTRLKKNEGYLPSGRGEWDLRGE